MAGREHFFDIGGRSDPLHDGAAMNRSNRFRVRRQNDDRLDRQRIEQIPGAVAIGFADDFRTLSGDSRGEKGRYIERLPGRQPLSQNDDEFRIEHEPSFVRGDLRPDLMTQDLAGRIFEGLGRSCAGAGERIVSAPAAPGLERIEARFYGEAFARHRHDTYAIGVTLQGAQTFTYRGERRLSRPGEVIVLHPDELHDGGAGTDDGLRYRMMYLEPSLLRRGLDAEHAPLPFVDEPVIADVELRRALSLALGALDETLDDLLLDEVVARIAEALSRRARRPLKPLGVKATRAMDEVRAYLEANVCRQILSQDIERVAGLDRFALSRHFRATYGASPHRFLVMRRLQYARRLITRGESLAEVAAASGFADQSHLNRQFKKAFGLTPGRWAALTAVSR